MEKHKQKKSAHEKLEQKASEQKGLRYIQNKRSRWFWITLGVVGLIAVILAGIVYLPSSSTKADAADEETLNFVEVVLTDLIQEESYNGDIGSIQDDPVKTMRAGIITDLPEPGETIQQGERLFSIENDPVVLLYGEIPAYRDIGIGETLVTVQSHQQGRLTWMPEPGTVIEQGDELFRVDDQPIFALYGNQPAYRDLSGGYYQLVQPEGRWIQLEDCFQRQDDDQEEEHEDCTFEFNPIPQSGQDVRQLEEALVSLGYDPNGIVDVDGEFTVQTHHMVIDWQRDVGIIEDGIVHLGEVVFIPGPAQVVETLSTPGDSTGGGMMVLSTGEPTAQSDVHQLEKALAELGFDGEGSMVVDGIFTVETYQAVLNFQAFSGLETDGILHLGEIVFIPGAVRVTGQMASVGTGVSPNTPVLGISLSEKVVTMALPADDQGLLSIGDSVTVEMPDNTEVLATVIFVSQTANPGQNEGDPAWFEVRITLDDPSVGAGLDEAPVDVIVVADSVSDVKAIPVSALVGLLEGGYAVEKEVGHGQVALVAVEVGFFSSNNMIEILSGDLEPGDRVVVP